MPKNIRRYAGIGRITAIVILLVIAAAPSVITADSTPDFEIADGHFYTQGSGLASSDVQKGFLISDSEDVEFLSGFKKLGGVPVLGYPISRRFVWHDRVTQVTQRAVMQWDPEEEKLNIFPLLDYFTELSLNASLWDEKAIPMALPMNSAEKAMTANELSRSRLSFLNGDSKIKSFYSSNPYAASLCGLPTSRPEDFGAFVVVRFQRAVLQHWKIDSDFAKAGDVTFVNAGLLAAELGLFPEEALEPEEAPAPERSRASPSNRGGESILRGVATWYGADFHGLRMRNGERFNMYDPTIAASNSHPMGTKLRVVAVATGKSVIVRVTDTGAFRYPIVVDLSWAAFKQIANPDSGVVEVTVETLRD